MPSNSKCHYFWQEQVANDTRFALASQVEAPRLPEDLVADQHDRINYYNNGKSFFTRGAPHPLMATRSAGVRLTLAPGVPDPYESPRFKAMVVATHGGGRGLHESSLMPREPRGPPLSARLEAENISAGTAASQTSQNAQLQRPYPPPGGQPPPNNEESIIPSLQMAMRKRRRELQRMRRSEAAGGGVSLSARGVVGVSPRGERGGGEERSEQESEGGAPPLRLPMPVKPPDEPWQHSHAPYPFRIPGARGVGVWIPSGKVHDLSPRLAGGLGQEEPPAARASADGKPREKPRLKAALLRPRKSPSQFNADYVGRSRGFIRTVAYGHQTLPVVG